MFWWRNCLEGRTIDFKRKTRDGMDWIRTKWPPMGKDLVRLVISAVSCVPTRGLSWLHEVGFAWGLSMLEKMRNTNGIAQGHAPFIAYN